VTRRGDHTIVVGMVNFPTHLPSSREGGTFVRLVVIDTPGRENYDNRYVPCCGGDTHFLMDESFLGDDLSSDGSDMKEVEDKYFPFLNDDTKEFFNDSDGKDRYRKYLSLDILTVVLMGATGWSSHEWRCTYSDLTEHGKRLYEMLQNTYPKCELRLLTFKDT